MSFIFPDPFLSKEQSFETMLLGLEYNTKHETPLLKPCGMVFDEENGPLAKKCTMITAADNFSSMYDGFRGQEPVQEIESVPHWDTWIEEILTLAPQEKNQCSAEDPCPPRTINQYSLSQILELPGGKEPNIGHSLCCSGFDIKLESFDYELCSATCSVGAENSKLNKSSEIEKVGCSCRVSSTDCAIPIQPCSYSSITGEANDSFVSQPTQPIHPSEGSSSKCDTNKIFDQQPKKNVEPNAATKECQSGDVTSTITDSQTGFPRKKRFYRTRKPRLCQFLVDILSNPEKNPSVMEWIDETDGIFKFTDSAAVARMWGLRRHKPDMKYENFSRSLRTYIAKGELRKLRSKLVYGFTKPENWFPKRHSEKK